jgi:hypothetical protein
MKNILNLLFLLPILIYVLLLLINNNLLSKSELINLFWITDLELPFISISTIFFIAYIFIIYFSGKFSSFFTNTKFKKIEEEKLILEAKLANKIPEIEKTMQEKFDNVLNEFKDISNKNLELHKNQTKQVLENLEFEIKNIKDKLKK